jgi:hypothetical protein
MDFSGFGGNFASTLAASAVQQITSYLLNLAFDDDETKALKTVFEVALIRSIESIRPNDILASDTTASEIADILGNLLTSEQVLKSLIDAALNANIDAQHLTALAIEAGLEPATLPFDWNEFLIAFLEELQKAIREETNSSDSKLRSRVAAVDLFQLRCSVTALVETVQHAVDRLTGRLINIDQIKHFNDFYLEYLGRPDHPKPFGGRRRDIEALNAWLEEPENRPKFLLVAPAGRGKSALLVHWARQLPRDVATVFIPVSIRFGTSQPMAFLPALAGRLAYLHGRSLPEQDRFNVEACRASAIEYMKKRLPDGRRLVIIVDGLDEAAERYSWAGQFPDDLPDGVFYVVSARQLAGDHGASEWMRRVGWYTFSERVQVTELQGLTQEGISEVLQNIGLPPAFASIGKGLVEKIHHLTAGDPLLVGLYAEQMWKQYRSTRQLIWDATELGKFEAGLKGFFEQWYAGQTTLWGDKTPLPKGQMDAILAILSQVFGPLAASELRELMRRAFAMDDLSLRDLMDLLSRFVIGDGKADGYTLSHPRLNEFFGEEPYCDERRRGKIHEAILSWGDDVLERLTRKQLAPDKVPGYLLAHLGEHYTANHVNLNQFSRLLDEDWIKAWKAADPTSRGFLVDIERVWNRAEADLPQESEATPEFHLGLQFRCMLYAGSIGSQYRLPPASLFAAAKDAGLLTARQILSIIAYRVDGNDFEQVAEAIIPVIARDCGPQLASLLELRSPSLWKVQLLAKTAGLLIDHEQSLVLDKARKAARDGKDQFEKVCSALALLRFSREEKRKLDAQRIVEQLAACKPGRITPGILEYLIPEAPEAAVEFAHGSLDRYFTLAAYENKQSVSALFALLDDKRRREYIDIVLARPIEYFCSEMGDALAVVSPWLSDVERLNLFASISGRPIPDQIIVLSKLGIRLDEDLQIRLLVQSLAALQKISLGSLVYADWTGFANLFDEPYRRSLLNGLMEVITREIASSNALSILGQVIGLLDESQKREMTAMALVQGPRNHDEVPCLKMLGEAIDDLPEAGRSDRQSRLARRIVDFIDGMGSLDERSKLLLVPDLLPFMPAEVASASAVALARAWRERDPKAISWLPKVVPFLPDPAKTAEARVLHDLILDSENRLVNHHLLDDAKVWLSGQELEDLIARLIAHAHQEQNDRQQAMELATLLKFAAKPSQRRIALHLLAQLELQGERDELWLNVISRIIEIEEPQWILDTVLPFALEFRDSRPLHQVRLLCEIANRVDGSTARALLQEANTLVPLGQWPRATLLSVISCLEPPSRPVVVSAVIRALSKEGRVYQLRAIPQLFEVLSRLDPVSAVQSWEALWDATRIWP